MKSKISTIARPMVSPISESVALLGTMRSYTVMVNSATINVNRLIMAAATPTLK